MLSSLLRVQDEPTSPEDIFSASLELLHGHSALHGEPGSRLIYISRRFGDIELNLVDLKEPDAQGLFAHYLWDASLLLSELIGRTEDANIKDERNTWNVNGERVLELGAGTGLAGIISALSGAKEAVISDYPSPAILANLRVNIEKNIPADCSCETTVHGHQWGVLTDTFSKANAQSYTRILCADCLWMQEQHLNLAQSMKHFLSASEDARIWVVAGFHTGRAKVAAFFDVTAAAGLQVEKIWECNAYGDWRAWARQRDGGREDLQERTKWLVVATLKRGIVEVKSGS